MPSPSSGHPSAILFDLDDTLLPWQTLPHWQWAWRPRGPLLSERHVLAAVHRSLHAWDRRRWQGLVGEAAPTDPAALVAHLGATLNEIAGHPLPASETDAVVQRFLRPAGEIETYPDTAPALDRLRSDGFEIGVATPLPREVAEHLLRRAGLGELPVLVAGEATPGLPAVAAFRLAVEGLGRRPREVLYAGDLFWSDVRAAGRAGLHPILVDRHDWGTHVIARRVRSLAELVEAAREAPPPTVGTDGGASPSGPPGP